MSDTVNMSDDDFLNLPDPDFNMVQAEHDEESDASVDDERELASVEDNDDAEADEVVDTDTDTEDEDASTNTDTPEPDSGDASGSTDDAENDDGEAASDDSGDDKDAAELSDAEKHWAALTEPFRANNGDMKVDTPEEARKLMSMGANYHKKMVDMKVDRGHIETLRDNDLLDSAKLNLLIDASKGKPEAIAQLLKDHSINPMDLEVNEPTAYTATNHAVDDNTLKLRDTLTSIRDTSTYDTTLDIVGSKWDKASQDLVIANPSVISTINDHVASGAYELITQEVTRQRIFNTDLANMSDIQAYHQVGNELEAAGKFKQAAPATVETKPVVTKPAPKKAIAPKADARRRAASAPKQSPKAKVDLNFDNLSDEEFEKKFNQLN